MIKKSIRSYSSDKKWKKNTRDPDSNPHNKKVLKTLLPSSSNPCTKTFPSSNCGTKDFFTCKKERKISVKISNFYEQKICFLNIQTFMNFIFISLTRLLTTKLCHFDAINTIKKLRYKNKILKSYILKKKNFLFKI